MRKLLLFFVLSAFFIVGKTQTIQFTNGGSTSVSGATDAAPISQYFEYMHYQVVYTAAEINAAGITGAKTLTGLGWNITTAPGNALPDYKIRLANTSATNSATHDATALTEVYTNANYTTAASGFDMLTLNGTFVWDGISNILVDVCYGPAIYASPYGAVATYAATTTSGSRRIRGDGGVSRCPTATSNANTFKPQIAFTFAPPPACLTPTSPLNTLTSVSTASHSWTATSPVPATGYEWAFTTSATPPASGAAVSNATTTANSTGLTLGSTYYLHVRSNCGGSFSGWATSAPLLVSYCVPAPSSVDGTGITNVAFGTINNPSGAETGNYGDYSVQNSTHQQGTNVTVAITYSTGYTYGTKIWIDFNDDLDFNDVGELLFTGLSTNVNPTVFNASITIPSNAALGSHRLRIGGTDDDAGPATPCYNGTYGTFEDYTIIVTAGTPCSGAPMAAAITPTTSTVCGTGNVTFTATTSSSGTGITYAWESRPAGANTFTTIGGASSSTYIATGVSTSTDYRCILTCSGNSSTSNIATINISTTPVNDNSTGAIEVVVGANGATCAAPTTANTICATTSPNTSNSWFTSQDDDVWYKFLATGTNAFLNISNANYTNGSSDIGYSVYTDTTSANISSTTEMSANSSSVTITAGAGTAALSGLTVGNWYALRLLVSGTTTRASFNFCVMAPPAAPACDNGTGTPNTTPANLATNIVIAPNVPLSWAAVTGATSYDLYFGTTNPPTTLISTGTGIVGTTTNVTGTNYSTTYYWYVSPRNTGGIASGCSTNTTSFTTESAPGNCVPTVTNAICTASGGDSLTVFTLKGEGATAINNYSADNCGNVSASYSDYPATTVDLAAGKSYAGTMKVGNYTVYASVWIDFNDNFIYEPSEKLLSELTIDSLTASANGKAFSIFIPSTAAVGVHKMRVRAGSGTGSSTIDPCSNIQYGETEDYRVNIIAAGSGSAYVLANPAFNACTSIAYTTVNASSNNNDTQLPILNGNGELVAMIDANTNNLGVVSSSMYLHNGVVRTDVAGQHYLNRNFTISVQTQPTSAVDVRLYFSTADEAALHTANSGTQGQVADINLTKVNGATCTPAFTGTGAAYITQTANGAGPGGYFIQFPISSFSSFFLGGGGVALPITLANIKAEITGATNTVSWTTATETNNRKFIVERSTNGVNYAPIGEVASRSVNGNSTGALSYNFVDVNPVQGKQYYRLQMVDNGGRGTYSQIVTLRRGAGKIEIVDVRPNPTTGLVYFNVLGVGNNVNVAVRNLNGQTVIAKGLTQSNGFNIDLSKLASGMYMLEVIDVKTQEKANYKVIKN